MDPTSSFSEDNEDFEADIPDEAVQQVYKNEPPPDVCIVNTLHAAQLVAAQLMNQDLLSQNRIFACDTEVMDIDVTKHSPCCHGKVICISIYCGPDVHFGTVPPGDNAKARSMIWIDTWLDGDDEKKEEAHAIIETFRPFFESDQHKKVWHNYSFDRHVLERTGYIMRGFDGDTMHMARLWDTSRVGKGGYSLEALSCELINYKLCISFFFLIFIAWNKKNKIMLFGFHHHALQTHYCIITYSRIDIKKNLFHSFIIANAVLMDGFNSNTTTAITNADSVRGKVSMKKLFGRKNIKKDGTEGKLIVLPPMHDLQKDHATKWRWINYSAYDAKSTWDLHAALTAKLQEERASLDDAVAAAYSTSGQAISTLWDLYRASWKPFGELLTEMESAGMAVDKDHLAQAEQQAMRDEDIAKARFRTWATSKVPDAQYMNVGSGPQVLQLLFAGTPNRLEKKPGVPLSRTFKVPNQLPPPEDGKKPKKNMDITLHSVWGESMVSPLQPEIHTPGGLPACSTPVLKSLAGKPGKARKALVELGIPDVLDATIHLNTNGNRTAISHHGNTGDANAIDMVGVEALRDDFQDDDDIPWSTDDSEIAQHQLERQQAARDMKQETLEEMAAQKGYGRLFSHFNTVEGGLAACAAIDSLIDASAIDTLLSNFIVPLQSDDISKPDPSGIYRVHCSLNINTETGRLSARRPNLQNQPALEKDRYKVRKAFTADRSAGKTLIVADYGQLELRILAHMANCRSMIEAFELGGDFHSRTALGMYDHIRQAIESGECLLEWDSHDAAPPVPLLKDMFASERRKAKVLNFSIAYGKTAHGLSKDWGVTLKEAEETVEKWYSDRPEVREWQREQHALAQEMGYVNTILGRRRQLPDARSSNKAAKAHALRAAINTPIQGSAADVATAAMLKINEDHRLKELGWKLLLQVHDEVILEGPKESAETAQAIVVECMRSPFGQGGGDPLRVELVVDSKYADTWYDAK